MDDRAFDELRKACAEVMATTIREQLADEPAEMQEQAVRLALAHPIIAGMVEAGAMRLAGRLN